MNNYPNEVKMVGDTQASIHGVSVDIIEWAEALIDPKSLIKLRKACRDFWQTNDYNKTYIINNKKITRFENAYRMIIAQIGADVETSYSAAFPVVLNVFLDKYNEVDNILIECDEHDSFKIFNEEITETIKKYFSTHLYSSNSENTL